MEVTPPRAAGGSHAAKPRAQKRRLIVALLGVCAVVVGAALLWRFTPLAQIAQPEHIARRLDAVEKFRWAPLIFIATYVLGGLVMFPVTFLSAAVAIVFAPLEAVSVSFAGIMLSAALLHWVGARCLRGRARQALGRTIERVDEALSDRGIVTIATIRMIPLAPFTLVNIAAGSVGVRFRDYMLGTALGLAPGITVICLFGRQVRAFWRHPSMSAVLVAVGIGIAWIGLSIGLQRWVSRRTKHAHI
jgi:phospholipase D1/2